MQLAIGAPLIGAILAGVQYFDSHIWQAVVLSYIGAPFVGAYIIVMAPLLLQLLPRAGGLGERLGVLLSPFNLCSVLLAYIAALVIDSTGNYRLIWLFPAATGVAHAIVNCWLKYPPRRATSPDMVKRLWEWSMVQAESMAETGIVTGLLAAPLLGVVTKEDADSAVVIDMARNVLGNPYEGLEPGPPVALPGSRGGVHRGSPGDQPSSDEGGALGVTGVRQVGGGPEGDLAMGDQKSGRGDSSGSDGVSGPSTGGSDATGASGGKGRTGGSDATAGGSSDEGTAGGMPNGGVVPDRPDGSEPEGSGADGARSGDAGPTDV